MEHNIALSVGKFEKEPTINEDAVIENENLIGVSDGAGGGGLFADQWSRCLLDNLPKEPIGSAQELKEWVESFWGEYYDKAEKQAIELGGIFLSKFYEEGSFATLVAVWHTSDNEYRWIAYGDSVAFCYDRKKKTLQHSFTALADFCEPPYLINCKDELDLQGFRSGTFQTSPDSIVFCCSDAMSHYILMCYELDNQQHFEQDIQAVLNRHSRNANYVITACETRRAKRLTDELENVFLPLCSACHPQEQFDQAMRRLEQEGLLGHDDYSLAMFAPIPLTTANSADCNSKSTRVKAIDIRLLRKVIRRTKSTALGNKDLTELLKSIK